MRNNRYYHSGVCGDSAGDVADVSGCMRCVWPGKCVDWLDSAFVLFGVFRRMLRARQLWQFDGRF